MPQQSFQVQKLKNPTKSQLETLRAIRDLRQSLRVSPTFDEIAEERGVKKATVRQAVKILKRKGLLATSSGHMRNLIVTQAGAFACRNGGAYAE